MLFMLQFFQTTFDLAMEFRRIPCLAYVSSITRVEEMLSGSDPFHEA